MNESNRNTWIIAAVVIIILALVGLWWFNSRDTATPEPAPMPTAEATEVTAESLPNPELIGPVWKLIEFQEMDGMRESVPDPNQYTLEMKADGSAQAKADCNDGTGTYDADESSIAFQLAWTRAMCPPGSSFDKFSQSLEEATSYAIEGDLLAIAYGVNTGFMTFTKGDVVPAPGEGPKAVINAPSTLEAGQIGTFDGSSSTGPSPIVLYLWDFGDGTRANAATVDHAYQLAGTMVVSLTVVDANGQTGRSFANVEVTAAAETPPTAIIVGPSTATVGEEVVYDGSKSKPGSSPIASYAWRLGGDSSPRSVEISVSGSFDKVGTYHVYLTVTDENGLSGNASQAVYVSEPDAPTPAPPTAVIRAPSSAKVGETVPFDGSGSTGDNTLVAYVWDFGDGSKANAVTISHAYDKPGRYVVTLTVVDSESLSGDTTAEIEITEAEQTPPTAAITGPDQADVGEMISFDGGGSTAGSSQIVSYAWNLGDGRTESGATVTTTYARPGTYNVQLVVTDENGLSDGTSHQLLVNAPLEGTVWWFDGSQPGADITATFNNGSLSGSGGCNSYTGSYTVSGNQLTISDFTVTQRLCEETIMQQEQLYLSALEAAQAYQVSGDNLVITATGQELSYRARLAR